MENSDDTKTKEDDEKLADSVKIEQGDDKTADSTKTGDNDEEMAESTTKTFFDVIDCVEDAEDDWDGYFTSDDDASDNEAESPSDTTASAEKAETDFELERVYDANDERIDSDCEECMVADQPADLAATNPLPAGWKEVHHESGVTLYVHVESNVCSLSRPYFLGTGSTKRHVPPDSAIPCMDYRRYRDAERDEESAPLPECPAAGTSSQSQTDDGVAHKERILTYCKRLFKFKKIKYLKFRSWDVRRTYLRTLRNERNLRKCPYSNQGFFTFPIERKDEDGKVVYSKKWIINRGKSYVAMLHEYLQQSLKTYPEYTFSEVDNARTPYAATVTVDGHEYGSGVGMSKKEAKVEAAKATLLVMLPKKRKYILNVGDKKSPGADRRRKESGSEEDECNAASFFDDIAVTDPRVTRLSKKTTEPLPYELLLRCLKKRGDVAEVQFDFKSESEECTMSVGEHKATIQCDNKRIGKQLAAQALLQALHPYIDNWGSLLRLYGNSSEQSIPAPRQQTHIEERESEEMKRRSPNQELLNTLRTRMLKLRETLGD